MSTPGETFAPIDGKVLRLHFACRAELPLGSSLRVTSSESCATTTSSATATGVTPHSNSQVLRQRSKSNIRDIQDDDLDDTGKSNLYTSSVEMVTTPETYPLWKTRTPVIRVVNDTVGDFDGVFRHRYRYLVVSPGQNSTEEDSSGINGMITSDGNGGVVEVDMFETPKINEEKDQQEQEQQKPFKLSANFPFRTLEIDISSADSDTFGKVINDASKIDTQQNAQFTSDGIRIDQWNDLSDISYKSYRTNIEGTAQTDNQKNRQAWTSESDSDALFSDKDKINEDNKVDSNQESNIGTNVEENDESLHPIKTVPEKRIFLVCYHLPIILKRDEVSGDFSATFSESLLAKTEQSGVSKSYDTGWIGTVSFDLKTEEERNAVREVLKPLNCMPIFLDKSLRDSFYYGMCKQVLWPAFHNIDLLDISKSGWGNKTISDAPDANNWDQSRLDGWWDAYCQVNQIFSDTLMDIVKPHDKVWVHDYHLSLLPKLLHEAEENSLVGERTIQMVYFLHIPFPTSQVFRELEHGAEILEGMLHADVVGFHAFDHARHFLTASKRILGLSHESLVGGLIGVRHRGTKVLVTISNVSIETDVVQKALESSLVLKGTEALQSKYNGRKIISGIDIAQGLSGISLKLLAYERMLSDYPNWVDNVVLMQRNLIPSVRKADEEDTLNHVRHLVKRLKTNFGADCIDYEEIHGSSLPISERLALWSCSDVFMSASIREGLNLLPLEYVYTNKHPAKPGVTLISEFSAMSSILNGALRVNPYDVKLASTVLEQALSMSDEEKISRRERDIHFVSTSPSGQWTRNVLRDLHDVKLATAVDDKPSRKSLRASAKLEAITSKTVGCSILLDPSSVISAYKFCEKRVIFVDFNGTIVMRDPPGKFLKREMLGISANKPPEETIKALTELCADERNVVFVVSGDTEKNIENAIGNIPGLGLAAGNGGSISLPLKEGETIRKWEAIDLGVDWEAVVKVTMPVLSKYTARANGSFVKHTSSSIGWSYYGCDPEWGEILATHLVVELEAVLTSFDIRLVKLKGVVEVVPRKLNKGRIVRRVLQDNGADFILCIGDDVSDEKMFTSVFSVLAESNANEPTKREQKASHVFTITVGQKASNASYYVESAQDVAELLVDMAGLRRSLGRAMSWDNDDQLPDLFA